MVAWKVIQYGKWIDTVYYLPDCDANYVLFCESQYDTSIHVEKL
jgi:hypothetical protein